MSFDFLFLLLLFQVTFLTSEAANETCSSDCDDCSNGSCPKSSNTILVILIIVAIIIGIAFVCCYCCYRMRRKSRNRERKPFSSPIFVSKPMHQSIGSLSIVTNVTVTPQSKTSTLPVALPLNVSNPSASESPTQAKSPNTTSSINQNPLVRTELRQSPASLGSLPNAIPSLESQNSLTPPSVKSKLPVAVALPLNVSPSSSQTQSSQVGNKFQTPVTPKTPIRVAISLNQPSSKQTQLLSSSDSPFHSSLHMKHSSSPLFTQTRILSHDTPINHKQNNSWAPNVPLNSNALLSSSHHSPQQSLYQLSNHSPQHSPQHSPRQFSQPPSPWLRSSASPSTASTASTTSSAPYYSPETLDTDNTQVNSFQPVPLPSALRLNSLSLTKP